MDSIHEVGLGLDSMDLNRCIGVVGSEESHGHSIRVRVRTICLNVDPGIVRVRVNPMGMSCLVRVRVNPMGMSCLVRVRVNPMGMSCC